MVFACIIVFQTLASPRFFIGYWILKQGSISMQPFSFLVPGALSFSNRTLTYRLVINAKQNVVVCLLYGLSGMLMFASEVD
jgi:hypothetical protein